MLNNYDKCIRSHYGGYGVVFVNCMQFKMQEKFSVKNEFKKNATFKMIEACACIDHFDAIVFSFFFFFSFANKTVSSISINVLFSFLFFLEWKKVNAPTKKKQHYQSIEEWRKKKNIQSITGVSLQVV